MDQVQVESLLAQPKLAVRWTGWQPRGNHAGHLIGTAELLELNGTTIPGVTLQIEVKAAVVAPRCLYLFSIMRLAQRDRRPIYQLEVAPADKRTHNGPEPIYGPHEHVSNTEPTAVNDASVNCESWDDCLRWFLTRTGVTPFQTTNPFQP